MEEIKVGEYVRTNEGTIDKVIEIKDKKNILLKDNLIKTTISTHKIFISKEIVKNHSKNIIDLIEVGDYVNGNKIVRIDKDPFIKGQINLWLGLYEMDSNGDRWRLKYTNDEIKSIVTKEQFANMEYRLED